ncbi:DUF4132 domain-containing protein [Nonomuraea zeae]|uniref:DUF4132 domain-containing protein n=1 Tax=Nonomuraea zeae TaxID=1642303 RepID=A0A5S4GQ37_9ACTN|nr:DUF4132 domain-containing protein [Nonomuraea zeae]TMR35075.1 DUF4132 domain-containing protein [Nonomuraea zeae]
MQLSPTARHLHRHLTDPEAGYPDSWPDGSQLTAVDLGHLLPLAYRVTGSGPAFSMRVVVEDEVKQRQPSFTRESCLALYEALVDGLDRRGWADLCLAAAALLRCPGGAPLAELAGAARTLTEFMVRKNRIQEPYALLTVAGVAGMVEPGTRAGVGEHAGIDASAEIGGRAGVDASAGATERAAADGDHPGVGESAEVSEGKGAVVREDARDDGTAEHSRTDTVTEAMADTAADTTTNTATNAIIDAVVAAMGLSAAEGAQPLAAAELDLLMTLEPTERALLAEVAQRTYGAPPELSDVWERLAAMPACASFARSTLEAAAARLAAIHARELPYRADKAFGPAETATIGRAARLALACDEPWLPELLSTMLAHVAVAPTAAKTLPSQALLYEIARAAEQFPTPEAVTALRTARTMTRHAGVVKQLDRMIKRIEPGLADRVEVAFRMPDLGFEPGGRLEVQLGEHRAVISAGERGEFELSWWQEERRLKSVPAAVRKEHPDEVKRLRELVKQVQRQVKTLVRALEAGFAGEAALPYGMWRRQIGGHPIAASVAGRLIWEAEVAPGEWRAALGGFDALDTQAEIISRPITSGTPSETSASDDGRTSGRASAPGNGRTLGRASESGDSPAPGEASTPDLEGEPSDSRTPDCGTTSGNGTVDGLADGLGDGMAGVRVRLWHPARATQREVAHWREAVAEGRIRQPFKQAFREVYPLTPAEEATGTYSNRFAAHIVDYRRLYAMFKQRGWQTAMLGPWDGGSTGEATKALAEGSWRASFHHDYVHDGPGEYASTDQVRFHRRVDGDWQEAPLAEVPTLVFSEAMRDVDLFVAVTSIAADPEWADRGDDRHLGYWRETSFGALPPSGEVRRDALARLLPRMAIAGRCTLTDRHLVVRGDLRTYRIHLGSANILMDPGDVYLCIVPAHGQDTGLFLPFEEDGRLALILSKALLLAGDSRITDESIVRQIKG